MSQLFALSGVMCFLVTTVAFGQSIAADSPALLLGPYEYEVKPDHEAFAGFNPRKAPVPSELLLREGDQLAICGDSITEQKMYSRTTQVKSIFHGAEGKANFEQAVINTEAKRKPLADAIAAAMTPVTHTIEITKIE